MGILGEVFGFWKNRDADEAVLERLRQHGSDLSKLHKIDFFFILPHQAAAEKIGESLAKEGFEVEVTESTESDDWSCCVTMKMVPELANLRALRRSFRNLAESLDGTYDGWGTEVEK